MCLKKLFCKHKFQLLTTRRVDIDPTVGYMEHYMHIIYCPKCKKEKEVYEWKYKAIMARQKADEEYESQKPQ